MRPELKPHIYLYVYPSGFKRWRVRSQRPGPWKRPSVKRWGKSSHLPRIWGQAYAHCQKLNAEIK
jgi:hypothetical protein